MKHPRPDGVDPHARSRARRRALQAIYAWQLSHTAIGKVIDQFRTSRTWKWPTRNISKTWCAA